MKSSIRFMAVVGIVAAALVACGGGSEQEQDAQGPLAALANAPVSAVDGPQARLRAGNLLPRNPRSVPSAPGASEIVFAGHTFQVRSGEGGPGPNTWSANNVWIDERGHLHLKIANNAGQWSAAEIYTTESLGFGDYNFKVAGRLNSLDDNVVFGIFNYPTALVGPDGTNEIDIEFATWGGAQPWHGNWTVWPAVEGTPLTTYGHEIPPEMTQSTHGFRWRPDRVKYYSKPGIGDSGATPYAQWKFAPDDSSARIPQSALPLHFNLWLFQGRTPVNQQEVEIVIVDFTFKPDRSRRK